MNIRPRCAAPALAALALCLALPALSLSQGADPPPRPAAQGRDEINHEVHLYLLAATADGSARGQLPEVLGGVARQLRATLPHAGYRVALTLFNRVRDGGGVDFGGVGAPLLAAGGGAAPTMSQVRYNLGRVRLVEDAAGGRFIHFQVLRFSVRLPDTSRQPAEQFDTGLSAEVSVREGEPTVIGTITTGRADELFVLVVNARRAGQR